METIRAIFSSCAHPSTEKVRGGPIGPPLTCFTHNPSRIIPRYFRMLKRPLEPLFLPAGI